MTLSTGTSRTRSFSVQLKKSLTTPNEFLRGDLSMLLTDFGRTRASVNRSDALLSAARENAVTVREDVAYAAKVGYFNVLRAGRSLEVKRETLRQRESLLKQAQAYFEAGIRAKIDVARAEANLYGARAQAGARRRTTCGSRGSPSSTGWAWRGRRTSSFPTPSPPKRSRERSRSGSRKRRGTGRAQVAPGTRARRRPGGPLRARGYLPVLAGAAGYGYAADEPPLDQNYTVGVTLSVPLFSGFLTREQVKEAEASLSSVRYELTDARRRVLLQVEQAAYGVSEASERIGARKKEREASDENLRLATARYEVGAGDIVEMIDAQVQMTQADTATIDAQYDYSVSVATLLRAVGRRRAMAENETDTTGQKNDGRKRKAIGLFLLVLAATVIAGFAYWRYRQTHVSTDDAYIDGRIHLVSARVQGTVAEVRVRDNQPVRAGIPSSGSTRSRSPCGSPGAASAVTAGAGMMAAARADLVAARSDVTAAIKDLEGAKAQLARSFGRHRGGARQDLPRRGTEVPGVPGRRADEAALRAAGDQPGGVREGPNRRGGREGAGRRGEGGTAARGGGDPPPEGADRPARGGHLPATIRGDPTRSPHPAAGGAGPAAGVRPGGGEAFPPLHHGPLPVDGYVTRKSVEAGQVVSPGQSLLAVAAPWTTCG